MLLKENPVKKKNTDMKLILRSISAALVSALLFSCTEPITPDLTFDKQGASGSEYVEISFDSDNRANLIFPSTGGTATLPLHATAEWTADFSKQSSGDWFSLSPSGGSSGDFRMSVSVPENGTVSDRECTVFLVCGEKRLSVSVSQKRKLPILLSPARVDVPQGGGSVSVKIRPGVIFDLEIREGSSWLTKTSSGTDAGNQVLTFEAAPNPDITPRTGLIVLTDRRNGKPETVTVNQEAFTLFTIDKNDIAISQEGGEIPVTFSSSHPFRIESAPSWVGYSDESFEAGTRTVTLRISPNPSPSSRYGTVSFKSGSGLMLLLEIRQTSKGADTFDWSHPIRHRSLLLRFTADWCQYCPVMAESVAYSLKQYPDQFIPINIHGPSSTYEFEAIKQLAGQFNVNSYPDAIVDGRFQISNYGYEYFAYLLGNHLKEQEHLYPPVTSISIGSSIENGTLTVDVLLFFKEPGKYKLAVYVTESGIIGYQADAERGARNDYQHDHIARKSLTDPLGEEIEVTSPRTILERSFRMTIPSQYKSDKLMVLVYTQRHFGTMERIQTAPYSDYYVDNSAYVKTGTYLPPYD